MEQYSSGIQLLDKCVRILHTVNQHPMNLAELAAATSLPRATLHRLATALEGHRFLTRDANGRWAPGIALFELAPSTPAVLQQAANKVLPQLVAATGESAQLYILDGTWRVCVASLEPTTGLRDVVPVGARLPLTAGSAARVLLAGAAPELQKQVLSDASFTVDDVAAAAADGWAATMAEREVGLASVSAAIYQGGPIIAALSVSGPADRVTGTPFDTWGAAVLEAARTMEEQL
ncbi:IclR family transcriptional regulator [Corynebacterium ulceribovis]|uniref:IclR family transcriptional regulator n=1 Tax=Corynebacterium ulceribovis TaxID=487732 RepID=UPI000360D1E5|nr:IclR family transcriptional regulator C-terminal domain-containing protein [Corynebacterium ulceribovis]